MRGDMYRARYLNPHPSPLPVLGEGDNLSAPEWHILKLSNDETQKIY
jgi:hypothetical protein